MVYNPDEIETIEIIIVQGEEEIIHIYFKSNKVGIRYMDTEYAASGQGVKWVYDNILNKCVDYRPDVWVHDVKILKYKIDGNDKQ